jgi:DNA helicase-2/ATP-dependent DNA helicase PcrA
MPDPLLDPLNPEQRAAVTHPRGPLLVLAGAGSGKTRVIVHRIAYLVEGIGTPPWAILAVTFTNKAAGEMRERLQKLLGPAGRDVWVSTFHSAGASILRREAPSTVLARNFTIYDDDDQIALAKRVLRDAGRESEAAAARDLVSTVDRLKNGMVDAADLTADLRDLTVRYDVALRAANAADFGDLLALPVDLFDRHPDVLARYRQRFAHVLVDEFQDTNRMQYRLLEQLCPPPGNLCVVGDDDQSIYRWRGAEVENILGFEDDYPTASVVRLTQNYRSDGNILKAAAAVIQKNPHRHPKELWTAREAGERVNVILAQDEREEARRIGEALRRLREQGTPYGEMAVFFRINAQSRLIEEGLRLGEVPYVIVRGRSFFERAEIKDAIAYLRLMVNPRSDVDLLRVLNSPPRGIGDTTVDRLTSHALSRSLSVYDALGPEELARIPDLAAPARGRLARFRALLDDLAQAASSGSAGSAMQEVLKRSGMLERYRQVGGEEGEERVENLYELVRAAREADERSALIAQDSGDSPLLSFLEQVSLIADADGEGGGDRVSVMTLHAAKGLEFTVVAIVGMEEGVFPHTRALRSESQSLADPEEMHEERRLCYVGFTRARRRLILSASYSRALFGQLRFNPPSRFLTDVPPELMDQNVPQWAPSARPRVGAGEDGAFTIDRSYDQTHWQGGSGGSTPAFRRSGYARGARAHRPGMRPADFQAQRKAKTVVVENPDWPLNTWVSHASFGSGRVIAADGEGADAKLTIRFERGGEKRIIARFVRRA